MLVEKGFDHPRRCARAEPRDGQVRRVGTPLEWKAGPEQCLAHDLVQRLQGLARLKPGPEHAAPALRRKSAHAGDRQRKRLDVNRGQGGQQWRQPRFVDVA